MKFTRLNRKQIDKLSDITSDVGLVSLASVILPALLDRFDLTLVLLGMLATVFSWITSLWLKK
ncbi:hypothetical protein HYZ78_00710 [Candidatus Microgenomates bacterium]|nr:hypothetical protein [Candidatus Microgenomates bacterium]